MIEHPFFAIETYIVYFVYCKIFLKRWPYHFCCLLQHRLYGVAAFRVNHHEYMYELKGVGFA